MGEKLTIIEFLVVITLIHHITSYKYNVEKLRQQLNQHYASLPASQRQVSELDYPPKWLGTPSQEFWEYCKRYANTQRVFNREYSEFISKVNVINALTTKHESDFTQFRGEINIKRRLLVEIENPSFLHDVATKTTPTSTTIQYHNDFTNPIAVKLTGFRQQIQNIIRCFTDYQSFINAIPRIKYFIDMDKKYQQSFEKIHKNYMHNFVRNKWFTDENSCARNGPSRLDDTGHVGARDALKRLSNHYPQYKTFEDKKIFCTIGGPIDTAQKLLDETTRILNEVNSVISQHTKEYINEVKNIYKKLKSDDSVQKIQQLQISLSNILNDLNGKVVLSMERLTYEMINEKISDLQTILNDTQGHISTNIIDAIKSKIGSWNELNNQRNAIVEQSIQNGIKKNEIIKQITKIINNLTNIDLPDISTVDINEAITMVDNIMAGDITAVNIKNIADKISKLKYKAEKKEALLHEFKSKVDLETAGEKIDFSSDIKYLDAALQSNEDEYKRLTTQFQNTKEEERQLINLQLPEAIKVSNKLYITQTLSIDDSTEKLREATNILTAISADMTQTESLNGLTNTKINAIKTELENYSSGIQQEKSEFNEFILSTESHVSKIVHSIAVKEFESTVNFYQNLAEATKNNKLTLEGFGLDLSKLTTDYKSVKSIATSLDSLVTEALNKVDQINKAKSSLQQYILENPNQFIQRVTAQMELLDLHINADMLLTQLKTTVSKYDDIRTIQKDLSEKVNELESKLKTYTADIISLSESSNNAKNSVIVKRNEITNLITQATQTYLDTTKLKDYSTKNHDALNNTIKTKESENERSSGTNEAAFDRAKQNLQAQQKMSREHFDVDTNFFKAKYSVHLSNFEEKYKKIDNQYQKVLRELADEYDAYKERESQIRQKLLDYKREQIRIFDGETTAFDEFIDLIKQSFRPLEESSNYKEYDELTTTGRNTLLLYPELEQKIYSYRKLIDTTTSAVTNVRTIDANYDQYSEKISDIVSEANTMIQQYEIALRDEYVKMNKVSFEHSENQEFFDSSERNHKIVEKLLLPIMKISETISYRKLANDINTETEKFDSLKSQYPHLNLDSIVAKFYPDLRSISTRLSSNQAALNSGIELITGTHEKLSTLEVDFNTEKQSFNTYYNQIEEHKKNYQSLIQNLLDLSSDKKADEKILKEKMDKLKNQKINLLGDIKQKVVILKKSFQNLHDMKAAHDQLSSTIVSTIKSLTSLKAECDPELNGLIIKKEALAGQLEKAWTTIGKNEAIVKSLISVNEKFTTFTKEYTDSLNLQKMEAIGTIDAARSSLDNVKSTTLMEKAKLEEKIDEFSRFYVVGKERFNSDMNRIITSQIERFSSNEKHCIQYIEYSNEQKDRLKESFELLENHFSDNSKILGFDLEHIMSDLDCCVKVLNGHECDTIYSKDFNECVTYIQNFDAVNKGNTIQDFTEKLQLSLQSLKVQNDNDELGLEALKTMPTDPNILNDQISRLEQLFKKEFKNQLISEITKKLSETETKIEDEDLIVISSLDFGFNIINSFNNKLDDFEQQVSNHESKYIKEMKIFSELSLNADALVKSFEKDVKNTFIIHELNKKPSATTSISNYGANLSVDEELVRMLKSNLDTYKTKRINLIKSLDLHRSQYNQLKQEFNNFRSIIAHLATGDDLIEKQIVVEKVDEIKRRMHEKYSEISTVIKSVFEIENNIEKFRKEVNKANDDSMVKIRERTHLIDENIKNSKLLIKKVESIKQTSSTINKALNTLSLTKDDLERFKKSLDIKKEKFLKDIEMMKARLAELVKSYINSIDTEKVGIDSKIEEYTNSYNELYQKANEASTDVPTEINKKNEEFQTLKYSIQSEYDMKRESITNYETDGNVHFQNQETTVSENYSNLHASSANHIFDTESLQSDITHLNNEKNLELTQSKFDSLILSVKDFVKKNTDVSFNAEAFNREVDIKIKTFTPQIETNIKNEIGKNLATITALPKTTDKKKVQQVVNQEMQENHTIADYEHTAEPNVKTERQVSTGQNKSLEAKDYFKVIIMGASVAVIIMCIAGANMYYKAVNKRKIYRKCSDVYTNVVY